MRAADLLGFAWQVLRGSVSRTLLILLAMGIGVAAVVMVTALGEGARLYVANQFGSLGTNLIIVLPGRSETSGSMPGVLMGKTPRDLTLEDALALGRSRAVRRIAPLVVGAGEVRAGGLSRDTTVLGSTAELMDVRHMDMAQGSFLPPGDPRHSQPVCVIGTKVANELFGSHQALGEWVRIGDWRFRVIGVLAAQGQSLGNDIDEIVIVPLAAAQALFDTESLFRILVEAKSREQIPAAQADVEEILRLRHEGERDVTVITQDAVLATFDRILRALTLAVASIAAISLAVAGILIMNVMLIAVTQRAARDRPAQGAGRHRAADSPAVLHRGPAARLGRRRGRPRRGRAGAQPRRAAVSRDPVPGAVVGAGRGAGDGDGDRRAVHRGAGAARRHARSGAGAVAKMSMRYADFVSFTYTSLSAHRLRTLLTALGIAVGIAAVILLTSIGEGLHRFIIDEFTQFGTNIIAVNPGRVQTHGAPLGAVNTVRPLTIDDAIALRRAPYVQAAVPVIQGNAEITHGGKSRRVTLYGVGADFASAFRMHVALGNYLPEDDPRTPRAFAVLGSKAALELFGEDNPLGDRIRVGGERYRVVGVMQSKGQVLGFDLDDTVFIPVGRALEMFNRESLMEIDVTYEPTAPLADVEQGLKRILNARHGSEDYTVTPQQKMLEVFGTVLTRSLSPSPRSAAFRCWSAAWAYSPSSRSPWPNAPPRSACCAPWARRGRVSCSCFWARRRCSRCWAERPGCCWAGASRWRCIWCCRRCRCIRPGAMPCWPSWSRWR